MMESESTPRSLPWVRFVLVALFVALDLWSKAGVFAWLSTRPDSLTVDAHGHARVALVGEWFAFMKSWNPGMAFGLFGEHQEILVIGRLIAVTVLGVLLWRVPRKSFFACAALVLVLAGALGNLYDNLFMGNVPQWLREDVKLELGEVRDFIDVYFGIWDYHFPTFNVADSCICVGAVLLFLFWGKDEPKDELLEAAEETPESTEDAEDAKPIVS